MSDSTVAIIGSGIAGTAIAQHLVGLGHDVAMFEIGPECPYPHVEQFEHEILNLQPLKSLYVPRDLRGLDVSGDYRDSRTLPYEQMMLVGGMATRWSAWTPRFLPRNFRTRSDGGYGVDWPITYEELEPFYCRAERLIGVSGSDEDNPLAPPRSAPYPLPPFELSYHDRLLAERLRGVGIHMHTVPQARVSRGYDGRAGCANIGTCQCCPIGARYSPNHHLQRLMGSGRFTLHPNTAVRRIVADETGRVTSLVYHPGNAKTAVEHHAKTVVLAAGALESARLLLLSRSSTSPDGLGNRSGHVGRNLMFGISYNGLLEFGEPNLNARIGPRTAQSYVLRETRGNHGAFFKIDFATNPRLRWGPLGRGGGDPRAEGPLVSLDARNGKEVLEAVDGDRRLRTLAIHCETTASPQKYLALSDRRDRFGDPFARVHHERDAFDQDSHAVVKTLFGDILHATKPKTGQLGSRFNSGHHHLGTCRMSLNPKDGVVDPFGQVHGSANLYVAGGCIFCSTSAANPTLTIVALALRTADLIASRLR